MQKNSTPKNSIQQVYEKIIILTFFAHIGFTILFATLSMLPLVKYNIFSCLFYVGIYFLAKRNHFRITVILTHLEICQFVAYSCYFLGWGLGFSLYLIALSTLVYLCPFRHKYIPYLFSIFEIVAFLSLKLYTLNHPPILICSENTITTLYLINSISSFILILYAAFVSNVSTVIKEQTLVATNTKLHEMVNHDALTHLWSRRYLINRFEQIIDSDAPIIIVMTDVDNFKRINDTYGHDCGDYVLTELAKILRSECPSDTGICRWGGEEFIMMFHDNDLNGIIELVDNIRNIISKYSFCYQEQPLHITMTFGVSNSTEAKTLDELTRLADKRMYHGKRTGKNTVISTDF